MKPNIYYTDVVIPSLIKLEAWTSVKSGDDAHVLVMAIPGQESDWKYRRQSGGPARSYSQFEGGPMSGLAEVLLKCPAQVATVCAMLDVPADRPTIFEAMAWNDTLACCLTRLLLYSDPLPLPAVGRQDAAWDCYVRNWHPGMPHPEKWPGVYSTAMSMINHV